MLFIMHSLTPFLLKALRSCPSPHMPATERRNAGYPNIPVAICVESGGCYDGSCGPCVWCYKKECKACMPATVNHLNMAWTLYSAITVLPWIALFNYSVGRAPLFIFTHWLASSVYTGLTRDQGSLYLTSSPCQIVWRQWLMAACSIHLPPHD